MTWSTSLTINGVEEFGFLGLSIYLTSHGGLLVNFISFKIKISLTLTANDVQRAQSILISNINFKASSGTTQFVGFIAKD